MLSIGAIAAQACRVAKHLVASGRRAQAFDFYEVLDSVGCFQACLTLFTHGFDGVSEV